MGMSRPAVLVIFKAVDTHFLLAYKRLLWCTKCMCKTPSQRKLGGTALEQSIVLAGRASRDSAAANEQSPDGHPPPQSSGVFGSLWRR